MLLNVGVKWQKKEKKTGWFSLFWVCILKSVTVTLILAWNLHLHGLANLPEVPVECHLSALSGIHFAACVPAEFKGAHSRHRGIWDHIWAQGSEKEAQSHGGRCEGPPRAGWGLSTELRCRQRQRSGHWGHRGQVKKFLPLILINWRIILFFQNGSLNSTFPIVLLCQRWSSWGNFQKGSVQEDLGRTL